MGKEERDEHRKPLERSFKTGRTELSSVTPEKPELRPRTPAASTVWRHLLIAAPAYAENLPKLHSVIYG